jgi:hypothetical protein
MRHTSANRRPAKNSHATRLLVLILGLIASLMLVSVTRADAQGFDGDWTGSRTTTGSATHPTPPSSTGTALPSSPVPSSSLSEGFDNITTLPVTGWVQINHSTSLGSGWFQGNASVFPAQSGATNSYIGANYNSTTGVGTINNWLVTPPLTLRNGATMTFFTRTPVTVPVFPDRLQVRMSTNGYSTDVGTLPTDVGDFTTLLLDINPTLTTSGYPIVWTQFTVTVSGVAGPTTGRLAFRYFVTNGGPTGANSNYIGIDTVQFNAASLALTPILMLLLD